MKNVGIITTGRLQIDEIVTDSSIYMINDENTPLEKDRKKSNPLTQRRFGSSLRGNQNFKPNRKNILPTIGVDKRNFLIFD